MKHDVIAFTTAVAESLKGQGLDAQSRWLHYGLTSNDVVDTAQALQIKEASRIIAEDLEQLKAVLARRAHEFEHTPTIGRTHGIHAEPTTFGLKLANWYAEIVRNIERFRRAAEEMRVGKLSGAVGTFAHLEPELEEKICQRLGLAAALVRRPLLLILDEPTNGLDPRGIRDIRDLLIGLNADGVTVFLSSHLLPEVSALCTRIGVLDSGKLVLQDELASLQEPTGRVLISTDDPERAVATLDGLVERRDGADLVVRSADPAALNARLVAAGVPVRSLAVQRRSLEEIVLDVTSAGSDQFGVPA